MLTDIFIITIFFAFTLELKESNFPIAYIFSEIFLKKFDLQKILSQDELSKVSYNSLIMQSLRKSLKMGAEGEDDYTLKFEI